MIHLMGTVIQLYLEHEFPEEIMAELIQRLKRYERRFSANDPDSELMGGYWRSCGTPGAA